MAQWIQPVLSGNGKDGDDLSVTAGGGATYTSAYKAFDSSDSSYVNRMNSGAWLRFDTCATIQINSITITSDGYLPQAGIFQVSYDEGTTWQQCGTWTDTLGTGRTASVVFDNGSVTGNFFRFLSQGRSLAYPNSNANFCNVVISADVISVSFSVDFDAQRSVGNIISVDFETERLTSPVILLANLNFNDLEPDKGVVFGYYADPYYDETGHQWGNPSGASYVTQTNAKFGNALSMDGNGYLNHDDSFYLGGQDFTVDGWAFIDSDCGDCYIANVSPNDFSEDSYALRLTDGYFVFRYGNYYNSWVNSAINFSIINHWFYFAFSYKHLAGIITLFINGVEVAHCDAQIERTAFSVSFGDDLLGYLDELRIIYGRALWYNPTAVDVSFDTQRTITKPNFEETFDAQRIISNVVKFNVDTCRNIAHSFIVAPAEGGFLIQDATESTGIQSLQIDIAPQQITDQFSFSAVFPVEILQKVKGQYLDYIFDLRIEKITRNGILNSCLCCSDIDKILYTQLSYKVKGTQGGLYITTLENQVIVSETPKASAFSHIKRIANILGKKLVYLADSFISTIDTTQGGVTYNDLIRDIFGWSSRVPTKLINCYIRNDTLYVIQRGHEQNTFDISNAKITIPTIAQELFRTTLGSTYYSSGTITRNKISYSDWEPILGDPISDEQPTPDDQTPEPDTPSRVLPKRVETDDGDVRTVVKYEYDEDGNVTRTETTTTNRDGEEHRVIVENVYETFGGRKYLTHEHTTEYEYEDGVQVDSNYKTVHHEYLTQGQQNITAVDSDGQIKSSLTTSSRSDDRPTPYQNSKYSDEFKLRHGYNLSESDQMIDMWQSLRVVTYVNGVEYEVLGFEKRKITEEEQLTNNGIALYDSSFPIEDYKTLYALTAELRRLNRTTQETVSLDIYDFPHIFDFNDKIIFNGNEYFLESNSVSKTPRIANKQSLKLVRWI